MRGRDHLPHQPSGSIGEMGRQGELGPRVAMGPMGPQPCPVERPSNARAVGGRKRASIRGSFVMKWSQGGLLVDRQCPGALIVHFGLGLIALAVVQSRACF